MIPKFTVYKGGDKQWRWRFVATNGETVASGEGYVRKADCMHAVRLLQAAAGNAIIAVSPTKKKL